MSSKKLTKKQTNDNLKLAKSKQVNTVFIFYLCFNIERQLFRSKNNTVIHFNDEKRCIFRNATIRAYIKNIKNVKLKRLFMYQIK